MKRKSSFGILVVLVVLILCAGPAWGDKGVPDSIQATDDGLLEDVGRISLPTSPECDRYKPAVAWNWNHDEHLVVWHNTWPDGHRDIYARRVADDGELLSWFAVSAGPHDRLQPAVVYNGANDEYLVVWMYNANGDGYTYEIWGRTVAWDGSSMGPEFRIVTWENRTFWTPKVAWNSHRNQYLVVWTAMDATTFQPTDIAGNLLTSTGALVVGRIITTATRAHQVDVVYGYDAQEYLVVWRQEFGPVDYDIWGSRLEPVNLGIVTPGGFFISTDSHDEMEPAVSGTWGDGYLVVWRRQYDGDDWDIAGQRLHNDGTYNGDRFFLAYSTDPEGSPDVIEVPWRAEYMAVYERTTAAATEIRATHWKGPGHIEHLTVQGAVFWEYETPAVSCGRPGFFFVYEGRLATAAADAESPATLPEEYRHIYGHRWVPYAIFVPLVMR